MCEFDKLEKNIRIRYFSDIQIGSAAFGSSLYVR